MKWTFLLNILEAIGILARFVGRVEACITGPKFYISTNGGLEGYFKGSKGLRSRDPLLPYFFVMTIEVLSKMSN